MQKDLLNGLFGSQLAGVDDYIRVGRNLVGIRNPGELLDEAGAGLGIQTLAVAALADFKGRGEMHQDESAVRLNDGAHLLAHVVERGDRGADGDSPVLGNFRGDESNTSNVEVAVLAGESEF